MIKKWLVNYEAFLHYLIIGVLTTAVSYGTFYLFSNLLFMDVNLSNVLSVILAVLFAYGGNKLFVFRTRCPNLKALAREALAFFLSRTFTMVLEVAGVFVLATLLKLDNMLAKVLTGVAVILLNYVFAKFVFRKS